MKKLILIVLGILLLVFAGCGTSTDKSTIIEDGIAGNTAARDAVTRDMVTGNAAAGNAIKADDEYIKIPLSDLSSKINFYEFDDGGVKIKYFIVLGSDGKPRTAFNACDVCGGSKGYEQIGSDIKCKICGKVFNIDGLGTKNKGYGCWPSYLPHWIQGDDVLIKLNDLKAEKLKFV